MTSFRPFFNPATGEWIEYTAIAEDSGGELVRFNWRSMPGGTITEHVHPNQEERFTIVAGEAHFTVDGKETTARAPCNRHRSSSSLPWYSGSPPTTASSCSVA